MASNHPDLRDLPDRRRYFFGENPVRFWLILIIFGCGTALAQGKGDEPGQVLDLADKARGLEARKLLRQAIKVISEQKKTGTGAEMDALLVRLAQGIEKSGQTQSEILSIFGEKTSKTVVRQVYFRRYREQWIFEKPVPLTIVFDCIKGREPKVLTVLVSSGKN
jgi:hypothetical protein